MSDFSKECTGCGACTGVCPFLREHGPPDLILAERPESAFHCTGCRRCDAVCPLELSPSGAFLEVKQRLIQENRIPAAVKSGLEGARGFVRVGHRFPFSLYRTAETVFWPGCGLAAHRPALVAGVRKILSRQRQERIGLVLDCCHDPVFEYGDLETASTALGEINTRLRDRGVRKVITGCLNCYKLLSEHLKDLEVMFVLEALPPALFKAEDADRVYLHHPCPSSRWNGIRRAAGMAVKSNGRGVNISPEMNAESFPPEQTDNPHCCGSGGGLASFDTDLADRFLDVIIKEKGDRCIVTYCIGCQNRFLQKGIEAVHLLEGLAGIAPRKTVASPFRQWANRFSIPMMERFKKSKFLIFLVISLLIAGGICLNRGQGLTTETLIALLDGHPVLAPLIFLGIYGIAPSLFLPSIPLTLAAGFFWGPAWGVAFAMSGATLGSCLPFFLSRYLFQGAVKARIPAERWEWLQDRVVRHGWKAVAFTRLIPLFPFNLLNYIFGLTPIPFRQYLWSTFVFMLPACIAFVAFGSSLGELILRGNLKGVMVGVVIAAAAFCLPLLLRPYFRGIGEGREAAIDEKDGVGKQG